MVKLIILRIQVRKLQYLGNCYLTLVEFNHVRSKNYTDEIEVWEAARCTTAAPWYMLAFPSVTKTLTSFPRFFKPKLLENLGTFQDGGLKYNNPVKPGLREVRRIWKDGDCDIVLSIGTGYKEGSSSQNFPNVRNIFQDGAVARLYRASMSSLSLDGDMNWKDYWHGLEEEIKGRHFRLDISLRREPDLDDAGQIDSLQAHVRRGLGDLKDIARAFKAASFFFELAKPIQRNGDLYICEGFILSRSPNSHALVLNILSDYPFARFAIDSDSSLGFLRTDDICQGCGRYQKRVSFFARHSSDTFNISLAFSQSLKRSISGFPHSLEWFEKKQMLKANFGTIDHNSHSRRLEAANCVCVKERLDSEHANIVPSKKRSCTYQLRRATKRRRIS
ncbi:hypothetical protein BTUL_0563g00010 [Botrytis tulipae]|uniref:PNPLA domain-containing protein n=1 Tax=Botrytis tulipae TaxID=87230 RepID=A0A4Z1E7T0_9HELO|nr:hypothetical protein BTUL_0563g00010 [Botrytis tulipae]